MTHYSYYPGVLQLEISSNCNSQCPGCVRTYIVDSDNPNHNADITNIQIATHPDIPKNEYIELAVFKSMFTERVKHSLEAIEFIGTIDDPLAHPQFLDILEFIVSEMPLVRIIIHSNSGLRTPEYFTKMANILNRAQSHRFAFSIDGLKDTNHLYRRNTSWDKIIANAEAFIAAGGTATWQFLIFPWNEHQVEEAKQLASDMGFSEFRARNNRSGKISNFKQAAKNFNNKLTFEADKEHGDEIAKESDITCSMQDRRMYFVNYRGEVWPCCFLNNQFYRKREMYPEALQRYTKHYGGDNWNNLHYHSFDEILDNAFYCEDLVDSWDTPIHGLERKDRILKCTETCSKKRLDKMPMIDHKITILKNP